MPKKSGGKKTGAASAPSPSLDDILATFAAADLLASSPTTQTPPPSSTAVLRPRGNSAERVRVREHARPSPLSSSTSSKFIADEDDGSGCSNAPCPSRGCSLRCSGCLVSIYCSPSCQKAHWASHKAACKAGRAIPFTSWSTALSETAMVEALHRDVNFRPRDSDELGSLDNWERSLTLRHPQPNVLSMLAAGMLGMTNEERKNRGLHEVGVMVMLCDGGDGGDCWRPLMKVGDPLKKGVYNFKCRDLGVDPCMALIDEAHVTFWRISEEFKATPPTGIYNNNLYARTAPVPIYFNSRTKVYMHC